MARWLIEVDNDDTDGDGLLDGEEDANHDGVWDVGSETNPCDADTDGDGMDDGWETTYSPDTNPLVADADEDPDGDGYTNIQEYRGKSDPGNPASKPPTLTPVIQLLLD